MADNDRSITKLKEATDKLKDGLKATRGKLKEMRAGAAEANKLASKVPAPLLPVIGGVVGYGTGYADAMVRTEDVKTPVTIAVGGATWVASGVAAYFGAPTIATVAGTTAASCAAIVSHSAGFEKGRAAEKGAHG
jgi:hypothetical protein